MPIISDLTATSGPTLSEFITEVVTRAQGFAVSPDQIRVLPSAITSTDTSFIITGATSPGVYEIDDELIYVTTVDTASNTVTVHPSGRGWLGTTADSHSADAVVTENPTYPRKRVWEAINEAVTQLYPDLYGIGTTTATMGSTRFVEVPADAEFVLDVRWYDTYDTEWKRVRSWEAEFSSEAATTGRAVVIPWVNEGDEVQVVYATRPVRFTATTQYWSDTGLEIELKDIVTMGALERLVKYIDVGRWSDRYVTPRGDTQQPQVGFGFRLASSIQSDREAAVKREVSRLRRLYPARAHFVR